MKESNFNSTLSETVELVKEVAEFIKKEGIDFEPSNIEYKGFNDLVSYVDKQAEQKLVNRLKNIFPEAGFITEEGTNSEKAPIYNWIIDPLDGTTNYLHGLPVFSISIALQRNDETVLGIVHEINHEECFTAVEGEQAKCNNKFISVSSTTSLSESLLATGFPYYDFDKIDNYIELLKELMQKSHGLRRMGSAAVDLAYTACGRFEGFYEYNLNAWDVAAGAFIVQQAGGSVSDFSGNSAYIFGREIIAGCGIHQELLKTIQKHWN